MKLLNRWIVASIAASSAMTLFGMGTLVQAGETGTHGGDTIFCKKSSLNRFEGYYSLDYMATYKASNSNSDIVAVRSWQRSYERIFKLLQEKAPRVASSLESFSIMVPELDGSEEYDGRWKEAPFGLVDLKDEALNRKIPKNCLIKDSTGEHFIQAIIRSPANPPDKWLATYEYDYELLKKMKRQVPLQFSFLMIHEWGWALLTDVKMIREINRYLHSKSLEDDSAEEVMAKLASFGVRVEQDNPELPATTISGRFACHGDGLSSRSGIIHERAPGVVHEVGHGNSRQEAYDNLVAMFDGRGTRYLFVPCKRWNTLLVDKGTTAREPTFKTTCVERVTPADCFEQ